VSQWRVRKLDRNHRGTLRICFVRAETRAKAERIGREVMGRGVIVASEYRPERDPAMAGFVREVAIEEAARPLTG